MDIESRPRWTTLIIAGLILTCVLRILPVSILLAEESVRAVNLNPGSSVIQSNGVDWWPMFRHDVNHTGYSTGFAPVTNNTLWEKQTQGSVRSSPAVVDDRVYVGSDDGNLYCLDADNGRELWRHETIGIVRSSPAVADGKVYIGQRYPTVHGALFCLNAITGAVEWFVNLTRGSVRSSPVVADGKVYIGCEWVTTQQKGKFDCFDASTGIGIWGKFMDAPIESSPAVAEGRVYVGSNDSNVYCFDASTGADLWNRPTGGSVRSSPAVVDGKVYVGSDDGKVYCLDAATGTKLWDAPIGGIVESSPAVAYGRVYVGSGDGKVYCLDAALGTEVWSVETHLAVLSSPAVAHDKVYVGSNNGRVYCLDAATGAEIWKYRTKGQVWSSPAVAEGRVYAGSNDDKVYAFSDLLVLDIIVVTFDEWIVANFRIDDMPPIIKTRIFDGTQWQALSPPIPNPRTAPFSLSVTVNPEPVLYEPMLTMATTVNPEPVLYGPNIVIRQFNGTDWTGPTPVPDTVYGSNPAVAAFPSSDELFLFWENTNRTPTHGIALSMYNETGWSTYGDFLGEGETPTATFYNDEIYLLWKKNDALAYRVYNPANESWSEERGQEPPFLIDPQPWPCPPQITAHDGLLYLVYESESVYLHSFNGTTWSGPYPLENYGTLSPSKPAITSFNDQLHIVYISEGEAYHQTLEGSLDAGGWSTPREIPTHPLDTDWWPMFHHDLNNTGYSTSTAPNTNNKLWDYTTGDSIMSSPAVSDSRVYIGSNDDNVYCLDATTGTKIWNYTTGNIVYFSSPAVAEGRVYVGSGLKIYGLDALTGVHIWDYPTGAGVPSSPAVSDGRVYAGSIDNKIYCLNASNGDFIWSYTTGDDVYSSPAIVDGRVYIGSDDNSTYCLNATTGDYIWSYITGSSVRSSPSVAEGRVYVGSADNKIYCLNAYTGAYIWDYTTGDWVLYSCPAVVDDRIFVGSEDRKVYCLNATIGAQIWNYTTGGMIWSSPAVADDKVYIGSHDSKIYCLDATTGAYIWSYTTGGPILSSPAVAAGTVFIGSYDSKVYAFGPTNIHDVAITEVTPSKTVVCQSHSMYISVTVENQGPYAGSFTVTAYYHDLSIDTKTIINLGSEEETTITFTWNTTGVEKGNYTLSALAHPVPGEASITDNYFTDGWVIVSMVGDITGPDGWPDGKCDMRDVGLVARYFGQDVPPAPANYDLTGPTTGVPDGKIDMRDIGLVARHFGETDP